jgi:ribosome-binding protein aMBF1 (putative translation factor)
MENVMGLHEELLVNDPEYKIEYEDLSEEFCIAGKLIAARKAAKMSQQQVAKRMKTSQSFVARLEGGTIIPSWKSLKKYADATGTRLNIEFTTTN